VSKLKFVLSDLHLGAGFGIEAGNPLEDFTADQDLVHLLQQISAESKQDKLEVELIINGDFFEFLQVPAVDNYDPATLYPPEAYLDSSQEASIKRLNLIFEGHRAVFKALSDFMQAEPPKRRITIIKGNHDVHLYWPKVKSQLRDLLEASGPRASLLLFAAEFISREQIYVEHGHQRTERINCYRDFHDPRLPDDPFHLYYPPGSNFTIGFLNQAERERWFVDSIKPVIALIWFAFGWDFDFAATMLASFIRHTAPPEANGSVATHHNLTPSDTQKFLEKLNDRAERSRMAQHYASDPAFREKFHRQIQPYLNELNPSGLDYAQPDIHSDPTVMGRAVQSYQQLTLQRSAAEIAGQENAKVVLFGHSHRPVYQELAKESVYINTGCWLGRQNLADSSPETWQALFQGVVKPDGTQPRQLPYARIEYGLHNQPTAQLLDFANDNAALHQPTAKQTNFFSRLLSRFTTPPEYDA